MAKRKKAPPGEDEARLKKKVAARRVSTKNPEGDEAFRKLLKRLKRIQRARRKLAIRQQHARGKKKAAGTEKTEAPAA